MEKSPSLIGKSTISLFLCAIFNCELLNYQRVCPINIPLNHYKIPLNHYKNHWILLVIKYMRLSKQPTSVHGGAPKLLRLQAEVFFHHKAQQKIWIYCFCRTNDFDLLWYVVVGSTILRPTQYSLFTRMMCARVKPCNHAIKPWNIYNYIYTGWWF